MAINLTVIGNVCRIPFPLFFGFPNFPFQRLPCKFHREERRRILSTFRFTTIRPDKLTFFRFFLISYLCFYIRFWKQFHHLHNDTFNFYPWSEYIPYDISSPLLIILKLLILCPILIYSKVITHTYCKDQLYSFPPYGSDLMRQRRLRPEVSLLLSYFLALFRAFR